MRDGFRATFRTCRRVLAESVTAARRSPMRALPVLATVAAATVACTAGYGVLRPPRSDLSGLMQQVAQGERISAATRSSQAQGKAAGHAQPAPGQSPTPAATPSPSGPGPRKIHGRQVTAIGDSVMLASAQQLHSALPGIYIDAQVSRQMAAGLAEVSSLAAEGLLRHVVIVGLGTNGTVTSGQIRDLLAEIGPSRKLVLVNTYEARPWEHADNSVIGAAARRYPNVVLANWHATIVHRTNLLWGDGVHPRPPGARLYAKVVAAAVQATASARAPAGQGPASAALPRARPHAWRFRRADPHDQLARPGTAGRRPAEVGAVSAQPGQPQRRSGPARGQATRKPPAGDQPPDGQPPAGQPAPGAPAAEMPYEQARDELIEVVRRLEGGGLTLEESLKLWERGERLAAICLQWLEGARARLAAALPVQDEPGDPAAPF